MSLIGAGIEGIARAHFIQEHGANLDVSNFEASKALAVQNA
ncbi:hypothetical protein JMUB7504_27390 [Staphylococcus aureus]